MKITNLLFLFAFITLILVSGVYAQQNTTVYFFYGDGCPHCANVESSGILEKIAQNVTLERFEIYNNQTNRNLFVSMATELGIPDNQRGVPLAIIERNGNFSYLVGDSPVMDNLAKEVFGNQTIVNITTPVNSTIPVQTSGKQVTLWAVILAALVDSINPCALGVLAFLMISLLKIGSAKRALRAGILYSFVVFLVYILSGFGIFKVIQAFTSVTHYIYLVAGTLVLVLGGLQIIDFIFPGKFISLRIPVRAKPMIERIAAKGTLPAVIALGALVALFELPCTGGIYIGILTLISTSGAKGIWYLVVYNLLFILPLLIATFIIYKGTKPEAIEKWSQGEKRWMKLASGIVMIALGIYMLWV